jgi:hemoglobin/transferrin/lactoferrin receptor protein
MKKTIIYTALLCLMGMVHAQVDTRKSTDTTDVESFEEILVSSQRFQQRRKETPRQIEVVSAKRLSELQPATLGDALINTGQVFVQKSQMGGSSPVLRGFEASRVLMVIDGVRMNNATYRAGHLQDIITIDPFILDRMEVNFGAGSTLYGSDALGGVLYFKTKDPSLGEFSVKPTATMRYLSASNSVIGNVGLKVQSKKVGLLLSATRSQFGDLRSGSKNYSDWDTFGLLPRYVGRVNGRDTVLVLSLIHI